MIGITFANSLHINQSSAHKRINVKVTVGSIALFGYCTSVRRLLNVLKNDKCVMCPTMFLQKTHVLNLICVMARLISITIMIIKKQL